MNNNGEAGNADEEDDLFGDWEEDEEEWDEEWDDDDDEDWFTIEEMHLRGNHSFSDLPPIKTKLEYDF